MSNSREYVIWEDSDGQLAIEFDYAGSTAEIIANASDLREAAKAIYRRIDEFMIAAKKKREAEGHRIFEYRLVNDDTAVETDFGAPARGLTFFPNLFYGNPYRYEPVRYVAGVPRTHLSSALVVASHHKKQGYELLKDVEGDELAFNVHFTNGGVTKAFNDIMEKIISAYEERQKDKIPLGAGHGGAILLPVPTYGLFLYKLKELVEGKNISIIPVRRRENGALEIKSLQSALEYCRDNNLRALAYYDCNPHNPTGYIREKEETTRVGNILVEETNYYMECDIKFLTEKSASGPTSVQNRHMHDWVDSFRQIYGGIVIIDDMAYEDLEHETTAVPYSFAQVSHEVGQRTAVLKGVSKIGLPGARIGLVLGQAGLIADLSQSQLMAEFAASTLGVDIITARYSEGGHEAQFKAHIEDLRREHKLQAGYVEAFFYGIDQTSKLTAVQKEELVRKYSSYKGIPISESLKILQKGLQKFDIAGDISAGFFYSINCESLKEKHITMQQQGQHIFFTRMVDDNEMLYLVFRSFGMKVVSAQGQGYRDEAMIVRATLSLPDEELFRFYDRMNEMQEYFFGKDPKRQLDLFRTCGQTPNLAV